MGLPVPHLDQPTATDREPNRPKKGEGTEKMGAQDAEGITKAVVARPDMPDEDAGWDDEYEE